MSVRAVFLASTTTVHCPRPATDTPRSPTRLASSRTCNQDRHRCTRTRTCMTGISRKTRLRRAYGAIHVSQGIRSSDTERNRRSGLSSSVPLAGLSRRGRSSSLRSTDRPSRGCSQHKFLTFASGPAWCRLVGIRGLDFLNNACDGILDVVDLYAVDILRHLDPAVIGLPIQQA